MKVFEKRFDNIIYSVFTEAPTMPVIEINQIHGVQIHSNRYNNQTGDGLYLNINAPGLPLSIKTADCLPIIILGDKKHYLLHAGWRGVQKQIYLQSEIFEQNIQQVFVGPHIQKESFEVTKEFIDNFPKSEDLFQYIDGKHYFDLYGQVKKDFLNVNSSLIITNCFINTFNEANLHSYRRNKTKKRNYNILTLA